MRQMKKCSGFTLLEVLVSTSVIMIGVFGIAGAIALSSQLVKSSFRSDMAANCGRAALRTMVTQNWMEDFENLESTNSATYTYNWSPGFGTRQNPGGSDDAADFDCKDHLKQNNNGINLEDNPPNYDTSLVSDYSWVGTVRKLSDSDYCEVSAAVSYKRSRSDNTGYSFGATEVRDDLGYVSLSVSANDAEDLEMLRVGQFVYLMSDSVGHWYRIGSFYVDGDVREMQLHGPTWTGGGTGNIYTPGGVVAAYTQIVPIQVRK